MTILLTDQVALVTGATRGLGKAIALTLAEAGATVIGTATSDAGAANISEALHAFGGVGKVLNVTEPEQIGQVLEAIQSEFGSPTILVNNAGITRDNLMLRMNDAQWQDVISTNLSAIFRLSKGVLRGMMKARHGRIISIGSVVGTMGNPGQANYCAAKAGVIGFSKSLAKEVASRGITVNVVAPGFIASDMTDALNDEQRAKIAEQIPMQRMGTPEDIAQSVLFLASNYASYITGETLHVNGGMYMN